MALKGFNPDTFLQTWSDEKFSPKHTEKPFSQCICEAFDIPSSDSYIYRAHAETTLNITQRAIAGGRQYGLHDWYHDDELKPTEPPHPMADDITAYTSLFEPSLNLPKAINGFRSNAKAKTLRSHISEHLHTRFFNNTHGLLPGKKARLHVNPYYTLWTYSCHELEWAGPIPATTYTRISHHILPIFYHHFGCVVPSYAALHVIAKLAQPAKPSKDSVLPILDVGSGNGYWAYMLRNFPIADISGAKELVVRPIDNGLSEYRVSWIRDTIKIDGKEYLKRNEGGRGCILLLVYPQATGDFTGPLLKAFQGDTIIVAGTQNGNGFTGFKDEVIDAWVASNLSEFQLMLRVPLPSFAGKDDALFVFQRQ